jgi:flagellar motor switch protein FliG
MRTRVLSNLSTRAAEELEEELSLGGPVSKARSRESQERVVAVARQLADAGTIEMGEV